MAIIKLQKNYTTVVDDDILQLIPKSSRKWHYTKGYVARGIPGSDSKEYLHRVIWKAVYDEYPEAIDHINGDPLDNRLENLRASTRWENAQNRRVRSDNTTGYKGVSFDKHKQKYRARFRSMSLGLYETAKDAALAYNEKAQEWNERFGMNIRLNDL